MASGRLILITGVTRGCGRAMVERFAALGHTVVGCGRSSQAIEQLRKLFPAPHAFSALDVTDDSAVKAWAEQVASLRGVPDLLVNNAAIINRNAPLWKVPALNSTRSST